MEGIGPNHPLHKLKAKRHRLSDAAKDFKEKGTEGSLTKTAHGAGYKSALEFAHHEVSTPNASTKMKRKAQWAINMNK